MSGMQKFDNFGEDNMAHETKKYPQEENNACNGSQQTVYSERVNRLPRTKRHEKD
jgi:hypothetical protein